jgi:hypothetical protein
MEESVDLCYPTVMWIAQEIAYCRGQRKIYRIMASYYKEKHVRATMTQVPLVGGRLKEFYSADIAGVFSRLIKIMQELFPIVQSGGHSLHLTIELESSIEYLAYLDRNMALAGFYARELAIFESVASYVVDMEEKLLEMRGAGLIDEQEYSRRIEEFHLGAFIYNKYLEIAASTKG